MTDFWTKRLFVKEFGLSCRGRCGFAAGDADDAEDGELGDGGAGNEDAVGVGVEVWRSELDAVVEKREQIVGDDAFHGFAVGVAEADPKAVELGAREEEFALGFEVAVEFADEIEGADALQGDLFVFAIGSEEIERVDLAEASRIEVAPHGFAVHERDDDFLMRRGWGAKLQGRCFPNYSTSCRRASVSNIALCHEYEIQTTPTTGISTGKAQISTY